MGAIQRELSRFSGFLRRKVYFGRRTHERLLTDFHRFFYESGVLWETTWMGVPIIKTPLDLWVYQEILHAQRPDVILETGTNRGGSALFFAHVCDLVGHGRVITVDVEAREGLPVHPRITYVTGSSIDPAVVQKVRGVIGANAKVLVVLDSNHSMRHVLGELDAFADLVPVGGYVIVEDTNVNGHPVRPDHGPGPWEAVDAFLAKRKDFVVDRERERFFLTMNPRGFLRRTKPA